LNTAFQDFALQLDGEFHHDQMIKSLYATDASVYRELPVAVAFPKHSEDIQKLVNFAIQQRLSLIPRAAGTSLAGQCVGAGIVVDISKYMNQVLEINTNENWVRVQPGVIRDELNVFLKSYGLFFGPNTSTANRCMMGGMVGNNSCGSTSIVYGATRDHVLELKTILSDGSEVVFNDLSKSEFLEKLEGNTLESRLYQTIHKELSDVDIVNEILKEFPKASIKRRNTGYAVDALLEADVFSDTGSPFNFCKMLAGSEGTLAFTTEIKLNIVPLPKPKDLVIAAHFNSIGDSLKATVLAMKHSPTACELMDKIILDCTKDNIAQQKNRFFIEGDPKAILMIELRGDSILEAENLASTLIKELEVNELGYAFPIVTGENTSKVWDLRKAGLGLLSNIPGDKKAVACIEDTAVDVEDLPEYIEAFTEMMHGYNQEAVYYAHAGAGELHLRPILDLKKSDEVRAFRDISEASAKLVKKYKGSLSGEHGDGRVRAEFIPLVLGEKNYELLKRIKAVWDTNTIFNPGKIVDAPAMDEMLRYEPDVESPKLDTLFNFEDTGGLLSTVEKCNGSGDCRKLNFSGGTMCPSYRATRNEKDTTRGRANILREFLTQNTKNNPFDHPEIKTALDLCLSCKGCKSECPSNIDMATLKAEFLYQYHKSNPISLRTKIIANNSRFNGFASKFSGIHNILIKQSWFKGILGVAKERSLPIIHSKTLRQRYKLKTVKAISKKVYLFCDEYTNYYDVDLGVKALDLLGALGYQVLMVKHPESGRAYISKGFLKQAKEIAEKNVSIFKDLISNEVPLIGIEPSTILGFRDEYSKLVSKDQKETAERLSKNVFLIDEFIANEIDKGAIDADMFTKESRQIKLHGHCHQKALSSVDYSEKILSLPTNYQLEIIPSGCCGMAGSFGYEKEHYGLSMDIGAMVLFPSIEKSDKNTIIAAPGTSCRHQIKDGTKREALHPIEILYNALNVNI